MKIRFEDTEIEFTPKESIEFIRLLFDDTSPLINNSDKLYYGNSLVEVRTGDIVSILPSENCVTNADEIKYDENFSGENCIVTSLNPNANSLTVKTQKNIFVRVHATWLQLNTRKNEKIS